MLDIETLGNGPGSIVTAIGAVAFAPKLGVYSEFSVYINPEEAATHGLKMDVSTVLWWISQSKDAQAQFKKDSVPLREGLTKFSDWIGTAQKRLGGQVKVWGNGADFDNVLLDTAYAAAKLERPWGRWNSRCYRTIKNLPIAKGLKMQRYGVHHEAVDDAYSQAMHFLAIDAGSYEVMHKALDDYAKANEPKTTTTTDL